MKVLVLAPHPFYQERGTPIAVDLLLNALSERGDDIDLLTFHEGQDRSYANVTIHRISPSRKISNIPPGLSWKKVVCDVYMYFYFLRMLRKEKYDVVHAIEESAFMALSICPMLSIPFTYDMDSSMVTQIIDRHPSINYIERPLRYLESLPIRFANTVIPVCDALATMAWNQGAKKVVILKDISLMREDCGEIRVDNIRNALHIAGSIAMYIGNLESYQGIDLMLESFSIARDTNKDVELVIIGGADKDIEKYKAMAADLGIHKYIHFLGKKPVAHIGAYMSQADVLISPRIQGENTPMKIYSYLHSGRPVLATRLATHTQVMSDENAMLADQDSHSFALALNKILDDDELREKLSSNARRLIETEHSYASFRRNIEEIYSGIEKELACRH